MKTRACAEVGIIADHMKLPPSTTENELLTSINKLNCDDTVHAILLQLPLESNNEIGTYRGGGKKDTCSCPRGLAPPTFMHTHLY